MCSSVMRRAYSTGSPLLSPCRFKTKLWPINCAVFLACSFCPNERPHLTTSKVFCHYAGVVARERKPAFDDMRVCVSHCVRVRACVCRRVTSRATAVTTESRRVVEFQVYRQFGRVFTPPLLGSSMCTQGFTFRDVLAPKGQPLYKYPPHPRLRRKWRRLLWDAVCKIIHFIL